MTGTEMTVYSVQKGVKIKAAFMNGNAMNTTQQALDKLEVTSKIELKNL